MADITGDAFRKLTPEQQKAERTRVAGLAPKADPLLGTPALAKADYAPQPTAATKLAANASKNAPDPNRLLRTTSFFDPNTRSFKGLAAAAGKPTNLMEVNNLKDAADIANSEADTAMAKSTATPTINGAPQPTQATETEAPQPTAQDDIMSIQSAANARIEAIKAEPTLLSVQQEEIAQVNAQAKRDIDAIQAEEKARAAAKANLKDKFDEDKFQARNAAVRNISSTQNVDINVAEGIYNRQVAEEAKLNPKDKESYGRIVSRYDDPNFNTEDAYKVAIMEYESDGIDADDMTKAYDAVASRFGKNFADGMQDDYLINQRGIDEAIVQNDRKLINARKLGETVALGQGGARETNAYLKTLFDIGVENVPAGIMKIINSPTATDDAKAQAMAFGKDFYSDVETGIGRAQEYLTVDKFKAGLGTPEQRAAFRAGTTEFNNLTQKAEDKNLTKAQLEAKYLSGEFSTPEEESAFLSRMKKLEGKDSAGTGFDFNTLNLEEKESVLRTGKLAFGTRISDKEGEKILSVVADPENKGRSVFEIAAGVLGYKPKENKDYGDSLVRKLVQNLGKDEGLSVFPLDTLSIFLSEGNLKGAVNLTEKLISERAKDIEGQDYISESFVKRSIQKANDIEKVFRKGAEAGVDIGNFEGTVQEWLGKFKKTENVELQSAIVSGIAEMRNQLLGSAVTETEERFLEPLIPKISDRADVFQNKIERLKSQGLIDLNSVRTTYGMPELDEKSLLDFKERIPLYEEKNDINTQQGVTTTLTPEDIQFFDTLTTEELAQLSAEELDSIISYKEENQLETSQNSEIKSFQESANVTPKTPDTATTNATEFIKQEEGFREKAYQDSAGVWTIGYGTTKINGRPVKPGDTINEKEAKTQIDNEISRLESEVDKTFGNSINEYQKVALTSFMYNLGMNILDKPEAQVLKKAIKEGDVDTIREQWVQYINAGGKQSKGLQARRERELAQFLTQIV